MPKYRVTTSDGRTFVVEASGPPTPEQIQGMIPAAQTTEPPTQAATPGPGESPTGAPTTDALPEEHTTLDTTLGILNTLPRVIEQGVTSGIQAYKGTKSIGQGIKDTASEIISPHSKTTGETPLAELGMEPGLLRSGLGLALDIAAPVGPIGTIAKGVVKGAKYIPGVEKAAEAVAKPFAVYAGLDKFTGASGKATARDYLRLFDSEVAAADTVSKQNVAKAMAGLTEVDRQAIAAHLSDPTKYQLPQGNTKLSTSAANLKKLFADQAKEQVAAGQLPASKVKTDYFPQVRKAERDPRTLVVDSVNSADRFTKEQKLDWAQHMATGRAVDPAKAAQVRLASGDRALKTGDFLYMMGQEFGQNAKVQPLKQGWRPLDLRNITVGDHQKNVLKTIAFPDEVAQALEKAHVVLDDPSGLKKMWVGMNRGFKTAVTTFNPAHHANNLLGNGYLMSLGGMSPKSIVKAYTDIPEMQLLMGEGKNAQKLAQIRATPLNQTISQGEAFDAAKKYNLFGSSETAIEFDRAIGRTKGHPLGDKVKDVTARARFQTSRHIEDPARWALFKDQILKGKSPEQAALHVKKYLFDYSELTDIEKGARDYGVVPFYAWLRKNIPLHVGQLGENPGRLKNAQQVMNAPEKLLGDKDAQKPEWMKEEGYQSVGGPDEQGNIPMIRVGNPALDLNKLTSPAALLKGGLGPVPQAAAELATGRDLRTGQQILGTDTGYAAASPLGSLAATAEMKTGIPMPRFGTEPTIEGTMIQPEMAAFVMNQIPMPLVPYAQRIAGSPGETIGTQLQSGPGKMIKEIVLRTMGLTPRNLTMDQQVAIVDQMLKQIMKPVDQTIIKETGKALRQKQ